MTLKNEAIRLFFAVSALILVGMLATPLTEQPKQELSAHELTNGKLLTAQKPTVDMKHLPRKAQKVVLK